MFKKSYILRSKVLSVFLLINIVFPVFSKSGNDTQIIPSSSSIYDDFEILCSYAKQTFFIENKPISVGEFKFYLQRIEYEELSEEGKLLYTKIQVALNKNKDFFPQEDIRFFINAQLNPEFYYRTNSDVDFTFNRYLTDYPLKFPFIFGFSNYVTIESDFFVGKNYPHTHSANNFSNIPFSGDDMEFNFPKFAYGSTGATFENWGVNFHVGKEGVQIGNTKLGSIIYNDTFETDFYSQLDLYSEHLKYLITVGQVEPEKYLYLHHLELKPFNTFSLSVIEGSLLNSNFELRYLNPFMIMHSFGSWYDYENKNPVEYKIYGEQNFCAYLAFAFDWIPLRHFRIYGMFAQNEILDLGGSRSDSALSVPDSIGGQLGFNYYHIFSDFSVLDFTLEAVYTSPYLYVKQSPDWSLYRLRGNVNGGGENETWLGSPFGPNTFAVNFYTQYNTNEKWKFGLGYLFKIQGENPLENVEKKKISYTYTNDDDVEVTENVDIYDYYPSVEYELAKTDEEKLKAKNKGREMWMQGTKEYMNTLFVDVEYTLNYWTKITGKVSASYLMNTKHIDDKNDFSVEVALGCKYSLF